MSILTSVYFLHHVSPGHCFFFFFSGNTGLKLEQFKSSWKAKNAMVKCLAVQFQVPESAVIITSLSAGSVIIGFEINAGTKFFF